ncbi:MAG: serine hydrolase domain-containing protein [Kofleriaceae bacterium]
MRKLVCAVLIAACSSSPKSTTEPALPPTHFDPPATPLEPTVAVPAMTENTLTEDTPSTDTDGNTFIAPAGWKIGARDTLTILTAPDSDSRIAMFDTAAPTSEAARDAAWKAYKPDAKWPLLTTTKDPDRNGWSKGQGYEYQTSPNEKRIVQIGTVSANHRWLAVVVDFDQAVAEKRGGQIGLIFSKLYPKGYSNESFKGKTAAKLDAAHIDAMKKFVTDAEAVTLVPGVSFGLIQDGKVVYAGGLGARELGKKATVDNKTLFMIASNTKQLTTLMLAKLVDANKLKWEDTVTSVLPTFKLGTEEVTKQVQVKHLVCACTGMPRQDLEWLLEWKGSTPESIMKSLGTMVPTSKFGELFQYSNLMAAAGGYTGGHVAYPKLELGAAYDKAMQTLVFDPLGMKATTFDYAKALRANHAMPHGIDVDGQAVRDLMEENYSIISARPAGAAWSNVDDILKYVAMELAEGKLPNGTQYISSEALDEREKPNVALGADATYGMGLMVHTKYDVRVVDHGGDMVGYHSDVIWIPEAKVGAVVLTNGDLGPMIRDNFRRKLLEVLYGGKPEADENVASDAKNFFKSLEDARKLLAVPADPMESKKLAAHYHSDALGEILVTHTPGGKTIFDFGEFKSDIASVKNPDGTVTFSAITPGAGASDMVAGMAGDKPTLTMRDGQHEYVFTAVK